jgi:hypothetical protein
LSLDTFNVVRPLARNGRDNPATDDIYALQIEKFTSDVEGTIMRRSKTEPIINIKPVVGTTTVSNFAIGESDLQVIVPGVTPNGTKSQFGKNSVQVDRTILARATLPLLDVFQTSYDARREIAVEHGKKIAKMKDQSFLIQAVKTSLLANSTYFSTTELPGHKGGTKVTLTTAGDQNDPAKLYSAFASLFAQMEDKDVDPVEDDLFIFVRPATFYTLLEAEQVINGNYVTAAGTSVEGHIFKAWGVPVLSTNNLPNWVEDGTAGSVSALMGEDYEGDFTKLVAVAFSSRAVLAGSTIDLQTKVFFDDVSKHWYVDAWLAFAATSNRAEFAGSIYAA